MTLTTEDEQGKDQSSTSVPDCDRLRELPLAALLFYAIVGDGPGRGMKPLAMV